MSEFKYELLTTDGNARLGRVHTAHGIVDTPAFMPVGTAATVKGMFPDMVAASGAQIILANTYHLMLRPGAELIAKFGGVRPFMNWHGPLLTDSGGYQVMSLAKLRKMSEDGVTFQSHVDGSRHHLTPERSVQLQHLLGATITMAFDECTPFPADKDTVADSMRLSMRWAKRSQNAYVPRPGYGLFGIVQGGVHADLRAESADALKALNFEGYAIGGLAVGEGQELMFGTLDHTVQHLPAEKPRYLMGVGKPGDIVGAVVRGCDMFDCVLPTRSGRTAQAFTRYGTLNLRNARHTSDPTPLDESVDCPASRQYSRAYYHHLIRSGELLGLMLLSQHNIAFYQTIMKELREAIRTHTLTEYVRKFYADQERGPDADGPDTDSNEDAA